MYCLLRYYGKEKYSRDNEECVLLNWYIAPKTIGRAIACALGNNPYGLNRAERYGEVSRVEIYNSKGRKKLRAVVYCV